MANNGNRRTVHLALSILLIAITTQLGFAARTASRTSHGSKISAAVGYHHHGLPCSTAPVASSLQQRLESQSRQLGQIERDSVNTLRATASRASTRNAATYRSANRPSGRQAPAINFTYQTPRVHSGSSSTRGR